MAVTVSVTGFSVTLTGNSVALTVAAECNFHPVSRRFASICAAAALHVIGAEIHVVGRVCNFFTQPDLRIVRLSKRLPVQLL